MVKTRSSPVSKLILIIVFIILVPTFTYTFYQFSRLSKTEMIINELYKRQLDAVLYSIQDHCWNTVTRWSISIKDKLRNQDLAHFKQEAVQHALYPVLRENPALAAVLLINLDQGIYVIQENSDGPNKTMANLEITQFSPEKREKLARLFKLAEKGYNKIYPIPFNDKNEASPFTLLTFSLQDLITTQHRGWLGGMLLKLDYIGQTTIGQKLKELESSDFIFAVKNRFENDFLYVSGDTTNVKFETEKPLDMFPDLQLLVRLKGQSLAELAHQRTRTNLIFLFAINIILIGGVFFLYKIMAGEIQLAKMKSDFVSNVSHELRTPLALIRMFAETLEMGRVPGEERKMHYYRTISNEVTRLTRMINNILDFSRIEAGKKTFSPQWTDMSKVVQAVLESYRYHLQQQGFELQEKVNQDLPAILVDSEAVSQALINLLENAAKYSKDQKWIEVELTHFDNRISLKVSDHGIGIEKTYHEKIFEKFYRVSDSLVHDTKGSGLGLSLVKYIMDYHKGEVRVESAPGKGSAFSLIFPISNKEGEIKA